MENARSLALHFQELIDLVVLLRCESLSEGVVTNAQRCFHRKQQVVADFENIFLMIQSNDFLIFRVSTTYIAIRKEYPLQAASFYLKKCTNRSQTIEYF